MHAPYSTSSARAPRAPCLVLGFSNQHPRTPTAQERFAQIHSHDPRKGLAGLVTVPVRAGRETGSKGRESGESGRRRDEDV